MLVQKKFTGDRRSMRTPKYDFSVLKPDTMLVFQPRTDDKTRVERFQISVRSALYQYKKKHHPEWETATRTDGKNIHVYRIK